MASGHRRTVPALPLPCPQLLVVPPHSFLPRKTSPMRISASHSGGCTSWHEATQQPHPKTTASGTVMAAAYR